MTTAPPNTSSEWTIPPSLPSTLRRVSNPNARDSQSMAAAASS